MTSLNRADIHLENTNVYNMLCDSVGISPAPNNGTLRLPLKPIGLHSDPDMGIENPADPPPVETASSTSSTSPSSSTAVEHTHSVVVDPVTTTESSSSPAATAPSKSIVVNPPESQPTGKPSGDNDDNDGNSDDGDKSLADKVHDFWDWFTGKVDEWWGKVKGSGEGEEEASKKSSEAS